MEQTKHTNKALGKRMQTARNLAHMTQETLAQKLFVCRSTIANYESGTRSPTLETLQLIAKELGVSLTYLLGAEHIDLLTKYHCRVNDYLTKNGHLDLSKESALTKIMVIEFYLFIRAKYKDESKEE